jgi:hypothetical protein
LEFPRDFVLSEFIETDYNLKNGTVLSHKRNVVSSSLAGGAKHRDLTANHGVFIPISPIIKLLSFVHLPAPSLVSHYNNQERGSLECLTPKRLAPKKRISIHGNFSFAPLLL